MIIPFSNCPRSVSGHRVSGDRLLRFVYVDEAGTSRNDPVAVVAGIIVNADKQWRLLEEHLQGVRNEFLPVEDRNGFVFHAKDLWHGSGYFRRDKWPQEVRINIIKEILKAIAAISAPICIGYVFKERELKFNRQEHEDLSYHIMAYTNALMGMEAYMRDCAESDEVAAVYAEDHARAKQYIRRTHGILQGKEGDAIKGPNGSVTNPRSMMNSEYYPIRRIVETVHFAEKKDCALLQYADAIAFAAARKLQTKDRADDLISVFDNVRSGDDFWPTSNHGVVCLILNDKPPATATAPWQRRL
ncbi:DUF3800 domain-containing protein [Mesorhizobium sp. M0041]|uniref:DUF3800 domain-containing protein n=1 Tax=Mesorhizobium sp. M0041 TaxID=2956856 RepID=UPI00333855F6